MSFEKNLDQFLLKNNISNDDWLRSECDWSELEKIGNDHEVQLSQLQETAELFSRVVQKMPKVHSVRWRVKDTDHLIQKIIRKCIDGNAKYKAITCENYFGSITDLIGLRALHLFKDDCFAIGESLTRLGDPIETPIAYVRDGDHPELLEQFRTHGFEVKLHPKGYRSVHYIFPTQPLQRKIHVEVQVRTVFEEGWSEIDHAVRYPNFSDNASVGYFLAIFNRLAGSADEMGGFVKTLVTTLNNSSQQLAVANEEKERAFQAMEQALEELAKVQERDVASQQSINKLKHEIQQLRKAQDRDQSIALEIDGLSRDPISLFKNIDIIRKAAAYELDLSDRTIQNALNHMKDNPIENALAGIKGKDLAARGINQPVKNKE